MMGRWSLPSEESWWNEARTFFFEKRAKKLLPVGLHGSFRNGPRKLMSKSFLVLFFKKEHSFFLS
jgi:hypothetical protein